MDDRDKVNILKSKVVIVYDQMNESSRTLNGGGIRKRRKKTGSDG